MRTRFEEIWRRIGGGGVIFFKNTALWLEAILGAGFGRGKNTINKLYGAINKLYKRIIKLYGAIVKLSVRINKLYSGIIKLYGAINKLYGGIIKLSVRMDKLYVGNRKLSRGIRKSIGLGRMGVFFCGRVMGVDFGRDYLIKK